MKKARELASEQLGNFIRYQSAVESLTALISGGCYEENSPEMEELTKRLKAVKSRINAIECALSSLDEEERLILYSFFINPVKSKRGEYGDTPSLYLMDRLGIEKAALYSKRRSAIDHFSIAFLGST